MIIGIPKEIKNNENRVAITPAGVYTLIKDGNRVIIESSAGEGSGIDDFQYISAGAEVHFDTGYIYENADIIMKVKEPIESEYNLFREGQTLFCYLHLAPNLPLTKMLIAKKITGIAFETVSPSDGTLPLLSPMSEVAGRMSVQVGANYLQSYNGGEGILLSGVTGVPEASVVIIGGGTVGTNAAKIAIGLGADVTVFDTNKNKLYHLDDIFSGRLSTRLYNEYDVAEAVKGADLLIGAVLIPGAMAPKTVSAEMVKDMKKGSVIVDVAIDQGGSIATIDRITTHDNPCYEKFGVIHYSVANMPGAVPRTSTYALAGVTLPYLQELALKGVDKAIAENPALKNGLNTYKGFVTYKAVADGTGLKYIPFESFKN